MLNVSHNNLIGSSLKAEDIAELQKIAALEWSNRDVAIYFQFDIDQFEAECSDPNSAVSFAMARGRLMSQAAIGKKIVGNAESGDIASIQQLEKIKREKKFQSSKLDIFGAFDDKKVFERISNYIATGRSAELTNQEKLFLDLLTIINSFDRQFGKRATIKFLTQQLNYSYDKSVDYYNQADQLFYSNRATTRESIRNKYAEMLEDLAHAARNVANTPKDFEAVSEIVARAAKLRKLDEPEIEKLPQQLYMRQYRICSLQPEDIGLPTVNRQEVGRQIDTLQLPENTKNRLRRDALIENADVLEMMNYGKSSED